MTDPWNATFLEIREWAINETELFDDEQDVDLAVIGAVLFGGIVKLLNDPEVPMDAKHFFLGCLYTHTGDAVRMQNSQEILEIENFILSVSASNDLLSKWAGRTRHLIDNPDSYAYDLWGLPVAWDTGI